MELPIWYQMMIQEAEKRKFNTNEIKSYIYKIFSMYERSTSIRHPVTAEHFKMLLAEDVHIEYPDCIIDGWEDFKIWHRDIHEALISDLYEVGTIQVDFLADGRYQAHFPVRWYAHFKSGEYVDQKMEQVWMMREEGNRLSPILELKIARLADFRNQRSPNLESASYAKKEIYWRN